MSLRPLARQLQSALPLLFPPGDTLGDDLARQLDRWQRQDLPDPPPALALASPPGVPPAFLLGTLLPGLDSDAVSELARPAAATRWIGPDQPDPVPDGLALRRIDAAEQLPLGRRWNLILPGDEPAGARSPHAAPFAAAPDLAALVLLALPFDQLRDRRLEETLAAARGLPILPLILFRPPPGIPCEQPEHPAEIQLADAADQLARWRAQSPDQFLLDPVWLPDPALLDPSQARDLARQRLAEALAPILADDGLRQRSRRLFTSAREAAARAEFARRLAPWRARLAAPLERLDQLTHDLPELVERQLIGEDALLRAGLRWRLRLDLLERLPLLLFPLRSLLGLLALTLGAWDRVILASFGSIPSLIGGVADGWKHWRQAGEFARRQAPGLRARIESLLAESYAPDLARFAQALDAAAGSAGRTLPTGSTDPGSIFPAPSADPAHAPRVVVHGLDGLEAAAGSLLGDTVARRRLSGWLLLPLALVATALFWWLLSGPLLALYQDYLVPLGEVWARLLQGRPPATPHHAFPDPRGSTWLTALLVSLAPLLLLAMVIVAWACGGSRLRRAAGELRQALREEVHQRLAAGTLRIEIIDPRLEAARQLSAAAQPPDAN